MSPTQFRNYLEVCPSMNMQKAHADNRTSAFIRQRYYDPPLRRDCQVGCDTPVQEAFFYSSLSPSRKHLDSRHCGLDPCCYLREPHAERW